MSRNISHDVVGLCDKIDGKRQRPSTSPIFKPPTPYFYGLLKIHKLNLEQLRPGVDIPLRLINNLTRSATSRSDKFINFRYLQPLQEVFCKDLLRDSTEALCWLEDHNSDPRNSAFSSFTWDFSSLGQKVNISKYVHLCLNGKRIVS